MFKIKCFFFGIHTTQEVNTYDKKNKNIITHVQISCRDCEKILAEFDID